MIEAKEIEGLRELLAKAKMPRLAVEPDNRPYMGWNDHIVHDEDANLRVAFMADAGGVTNYRSALIVAAVNALPALLAAHASQAEQIAKLREALEPFANMGELIELETEGFADDDDLHLIVESGHLMDRFPVKAFRAASQALQTEGE